MTLRVLRSAFVLAIAVACFGFAPVSGYHVGDVVTPFSLKNVDGTMYATSAQSTKGFIVVFTCNHCPFAKMYEDRIIALDKEFAAKGFPVIAINPNDVSQVPDDSFDNMMKRAKEKHYSFPYLYDETQDVVKAFGATNTPHVFVLARENNKLVVKYIGAIDNNAQDASQATVHYVADAVNALLAGKPVAVSATKAIGCSIKMKRV